MFRFHLKTISLLVSTSLLLSIFLVVVPAMADNPTIEPWELLGAQDTLLNGLCSSGNLLLATTGEGFHIYNHQTAQWTDRTWPGWIGRGKYAVVKSALNPNRLILGGVNAWFKGTLFYSNDNGENDTLVMESNGGRVTDIEASIDIIPTLYACTWADVVDGELLRSEDDGASWTLITGHGHHTMTALSVIDASEVYVAGDNYLSATTDGGLTWTNLQSNLPDNQGVYCLLALPPYTGLPAPDKSDTADNDTEKNEFNVDQLMVSNDTALYRYDFETDLWDTILPSSCRAIAHQIRQTDTFVYWTETYAVTWDHRVMFCKDQDWDNWEDVTAELSPGTPIDIEANNWGVFVAMQGEGVYRSEGHLHSSNVPGNQTMISLLAYPNPFNPATTIKYESPKSGHGLLQVFDMRGALVKTLVDGEITAGQHITNWRPAGLSSGVYRVLFKTDGQSVSHQVILLK